MTGSDEKVTKVIIHHDLLIVTAVVSTSYMGRSFYYYYLFHSLGSRLSLGSELELIDDSRKRYNVL